MTELFDWVELWKNVQKCGYGFPAIPGGRGMVRQGLQTSDEEREAELLGETKQKGPMSRVREGPSKGLIFIK